MKVLNGRFQSCSLQLNPASQKRHKGRSSSFKRETGSGVRGVRELLNLSYFVNYDSKRNPSKPRTSQYRG
jgi:hypothetical protein